MRHAMGILMAVLLPLTCVVSMLPGQQAVTAPRRLRFADGGGGSTLRNDMVAWWSLDEASGTRADSHASYDVAGFSTQPGSTTGKIADAASFVSASSQSLGVADPFYISGAMSVAMWINRSSFGALVFPVAKGTANQIGEFQMYFGSDNKFGFFVVDNSAAAYIGQQQTTASITASGWRYLTATYDGGTAASGIKLYIDGALVASGAISSGTFSNIDDTSTSLEFGERNNSWFLNGSIDEAAIWSREVTSTEIAELYNSGAGISYADTAP